MQEHLTTDTFKEKIFNYEAEKEWNYLGDTPCIIDFYADWCQPCKIIAPILEELEKEYNGKLIVYKINTEEQHELAGIFGIQSIPSLLFVPTEGQPQMAVGALPKETFEAAIKDVLKIEKEEQTQE
jgi:thioredoxin